MGDLEDWQYRSRWADGTTFTAEDLKTLGLKKILKRRKKEVPGKRGPKPDYPGPSADIPAAENVTSHGKGRGRNEWLDKKLLIVPLLDEPVKVRRESKRWRNQQVILQCKTVGEALNRLSALTSPGSGADIRLAVKNEVIELKKE